MRPFVVGETLRRIVSKAAAARIGPQLREALEPVQLGVGTRNGCEIIAQSARCWFLQQDEDFVEAKEKVS